MNSKAHGIAISLSVVLTASGLGIGCQANDAQAQEAAPDAVNATVATPPRAQVTKIVFVGKEHACDCTRSRVDKTWKVLQEALGKTARVTVERLHSDTQADKVAPYQKKRPIMALPALYFLDSKSEVVELLQGEVTLEQVRGAIGKS